MKEARITYGALGVVEKIIDKKKETTTIVVKSQGDLELSDGYHTVSELYDHRITLFISLCRLLKERNYYYSLQHGDKRGPTATIWRSKLHADGSTFEGWFILGIGTEKGQQITYHLPLSQWDECGFAETFERGPEFDGHSSADVLNRLKQL
jgi:hypothetical protein